jgi:hypothetical protein
VRICVSRSRGLHPGRTPVILPKRGADHRKRSRAGKGRTHAFCNLQYRFGGFGARHGNLRSDGVGPKYGSVGPMDEGPNCQAIMRGKPYAARFYGFFNSGGLALVAPRISATKTRNVIPVDDCPYLALFGVKVCCASSHTGTTRIGLTISRLTTPRKNEMCWNIICVCAHSGNVWHLRPLGQKSAKSVCVVVWSDMITPLAGEC